MAEEEQKKSKFNIAVATLQRLNNGLIVAFQKYQQGNIRGWFFELKGIKLQIIGKMSKQERGELKDIENKITILFHKKVGEIRAIELIEQYNERLQDLMEQKGLLMIDEEDRTVFT